MGNRISLHPAVRSSSIRSQQVYLGSAPHAVIELGVPEVHVCLDGPRAALPYKFLDEMAEGGGTDYLCFALDVREGLSADTELAYWGRQWISFATDAPRGFDADEVAALRSLLPVISLRFALEASKLTARALLASYLGGNASRRTLAVREGHGETVAAVDATPDGARGASASWDGTVRLWDLRRRAAGRVLEGHGAQVAAVRLSPDGQVVECSA